MTSSGAARLARKADSADSVLLLDVVRAALVRHGGERWTLSPGEAWCYVSAPVAASRQHGWKLHISATPLSAALTLARCAEVLIRNECSFKFGIDIQRVAQLVDGWYDRGGSGKFITVDPRDDDQLRVVAHELDQITDGLSGPRILSDRQLRPGSLVHLRYGEYTQDRVLTDDGVFESRMVGPDGIAVTDERRPWFSPPAWAEWPFPQESAVADTVPESMQLAGRFLIRAAIRHASKGGVYRAVDEHDGSEVVIKQARAHVGAGVDGKDVRDRLREEARMLDVLAPLGVAPRFVALFEEQGHLFLAQQLVPGTTLQKWAGDRAGAGGPTATEVTDLIRRLVELLRTVHAAGLVIRDFKPQNLIVSPDGEVRMIDTEFVAELGQERTVILTPGFVAPEIEQADRHRRLRPVPEQSSDWFSLGVTVFCLLTSLGPDWLKGPDGKQRGAEELARTFDEMAGSYPALTAFADLIVGLTEADPDRRWSLERTVESLRTIEASTRDRTPSAHTPTGSAISVEALDRLLVDGVAHLTGGMTPHLSALWKSQAGIDADVCGAWFGAAGGLAALTRTAHALGDASLRPAVTTAASWIGQRLFAVPRLLPGLCFGRAGTAWALHDAACLLGDDALASRALELARALPVEGPSPDITHGLAGAGMAHLHLWQATAAPEMLDRATTYADAVLAAARRSGEDWQWPTAAEADSRLAGSNAYGFAHGVAGTGAFLLAAAQSTSRYAQSHQYWLAAIGAGDTLARGARYRHGQIEWPAAFNHDRVGLGNWCNGPSGIGTFLIRLGAATSEQRYLTLAEQAAATVVQNRWKATVGACCGLAGDGQFLLDMADITGDDHYRRLAETIAATIHTQRGTADDLELAADRRDGFDYAQGTAGVLDFLVRLRHGGARPWMPTISPLIALVKP